MIEEQALLHTLPAGHPLRTRPLAGCHHRWRKGKAWREIKPSYKIASKTYNDLGPAWKKAADWCWTP